MDTGRNYCFLFLQKMLLKIHKNLVILSTADNVFEDGIPVNDRLELLLNYLEKELKKYGLFTKFETVPKEIRRKQLLYLLTTYLRQQPNLGAGDASCKGSTPCSSYVTVTFSNNSSYEDEQDKEEDSFNLNIRIRESVKKIASYDTGNLNNLYVQYQLYSGILRQIEMELNGKDIAISDPLVNVLIIGLCVRLQKDTKFNELENLSFLEQRRELLNLLRSDLIEKCNKISLFDMVEDATKDTHNFLKEKYNSYPRKIWEKVINIGPSLDLMVPLYDTYPTFIIEMFLEYLVEAKESIIMEQEHIFRAKMVLLKKEAVNTIQSIKQHLIGMKSIDDFLNEYRQQFEVSYDKTESEFYRQEILKNDINKIMLQIKKTALLSDLIMKEINKDIEDREAQVKDFSKFMNNITVQIKNAFSSNSST